MTSNNIFVWALNNLRSGVLLVEKDTGRVMEANAAVLRICGRPRYEVVGRNIWEPPFIEDAEAGAEVLAHLRGGGQLEKVALPLTTGRGTRVLLELSSAELAGGIVEVEVADGTLRASARLAERTDAQRSLAARVAGEFAGIAETLRAAGEALESCANHHQAGATRNAADRARDMSHELLAYSGQLTLESSPVRLNELIEGMRPQIERTLGRDIQFVADMGGDVPHVLADPAQVRRMVLELAANSREAIFASTSASISACRKRSGAFHISTRTAAADDPALGNHGGVSSYAILEARDEGPGLDDESWEHLFEPFRTTRGNGKPGLGLAAVHGAVRQMGGSMWAHSEPGKGATFRIYLPMTPAPAVAPKEPARRPSTILVVEHNEGLRTVVTSILKKRGYRVLAAGAAADALELAKREGPPDLLITEPEPDLAKSLSSMQPQLHTLYLNGHSDHRSEHGDVPSISKPFELDTLLGKVRELLDV